MAKPTSTPTALDHPFDKHGGPVITNGSGRSGEAEYRGRIVSPTCTEGRIDAAGTAEFGGAMPNGDGAGAPAEGVADGTAGGTAPAPPAERPAPEAAAPQGSGAGRMPLGRAEQRVAIALIGIFMLFVVALVVMRSDQYWDRLVFLLAGVEALVFAAAGALFGTSVQRTQAVEARQQAVQERQAAAKERERADQFEQQARSGQALADVIRAKAGLPPAGAGGSDEPGGGEGRGARPDRPPLRAGAGDGAGGGAGGADRDLTELAEMVDRWFPRSPGAAGR